MFFSEPRRKTKAQKRREKGRRSYRKGKQFEKKGYSFLGRTLKGYKITKTPVRSKRRDEFDALAIDKHGHAYAIEIKNTKQKVGVAVVRKLKKKVTKHKGFLHGGIIVSKSGFTKSSETEAKRQGIKTLKYKQKRKTSDWFW